jgi:hypothetical protein
MFTARYGLYLCVFYVDLRTNSDYLSIQHSLTGFYNRDGECLLRGTDCIYVFCVDLRTNGDYFSIQHSLTGFYNRDGMFTARYELGL